MSKAKINRDRILRELRAIGFAKVTDFLYIQDEEIHVKGTESLKPANRAAIASVERTSNGLKLKFYDKMKALELLGKCAGMFDGTEDGATQEQCNLLQAILESTEGEVDTHDIPELQQTADAGHDLVESAGTGGV